MSPTYITQVPIFNDYINLFLPRDFWFALIYKENPELSYFEDNFLSQLEPTNPLLVPGTNKLVGFWEMLAVAKWIGDGDCLVGKTCGYILEEDVAVVYKTGINFGIGLDEKTPTKDIPVGPSKNIIFDSI